MEFVQLLHLILILLLEVVLLEQLHLVALLALVLGIGAVLD
jgi:hypothetical protein